jgi:hypothetical protein
MRTHLEFISTAFSRVLGEDEEINPGRFGMKLAEFLAESLAACGYNVIDKFAEDWGWRIELENHTFPLWVGCGNYEEFENGFLCFIEPSKPLLRRWLSKIDTATTVEKLASAIETALLQSGKVSSLRWWSDSETVY